MVGGNQYGSKANSGTQKMCIRDRYYIKKYVKIWNIKKYQSHVILEIGIGKDVKG